MRPRAKAGPGSVPRRRVTLSRALSKRGIASRAEASRLIARGDVSVNGRKVADPGAWVDPVLDSITCGGEMLKPLRRFYVAMNKPAGFVTTRSDEKGRKTVYDLLPERYPWLFPVGRLDMESSGLLLFTNDTMFGERVTGPALNVPKSYSVVLEKPLDASGARAMREGIILRGGVRCLPAKVTIDAHDAHRCLVIITEGKNRQVRRMFEALGNRVVRLHRLAIGPVTIGGLKEGHVRELSAGEVASLSGNQGRKAGHA